MGGAENLARQHEIGKLARVGQYDDDGRLISFTPANYLFGSAEIDGRPVMVSGDDFTVRGGSADASIAGKRQQAGPLWTPMRHA